MRVKQIVDFYRNKKDMPCPLTKSLIGAGYHQKFKTGYLENINCIQHIPHQYDHLMNYCEERLKVKGDDVIYPYTPCGELLFWMAEVSDFVDKIKLEKLANLIIEEIKENKFSGRKYWSKQIKEICYEPIKNHFKDN